MTSALAFVGAATVADRRSRFEAWWDVDVDGSDPRRSMDIFAPTDADGTNPVILCWHGGGGVVGTRRAMHRLPVSGDAIGYFVDAGYVVANCSYRLYDLITEPHNHFPIPQQDCANELNYMIDHAADYGGDPNFIALWGGSQGASYALLTGSAFAADPRIRTVVARSPGVTYCLTNPRILSPLEPIGTYIQRLSLHEQEVLFHLGQTSPDGSYLNCAAGGAYDDIMEAAQPRSNIDPGQCPIHLSVSSAESMPATSVATHAQAAKAAGVQWTLDVNGTVGTGLANYLNVTLGLAGEWTNVNPTLGPGAYGGASQHADSLGHMARDLAYIEHDLLAQRVIQNAVITRTGTPLGIGVQHT